MWPFWKVSIRMKSSKSCWIYWSLKILIDCSRYLTERYMVSRSYTKYRWLCWKGQGWDLGETELFTLFSRLGSKISLSLARFRNSGTSTHPLNCLNVWYVSYSCHRTPCLMRNPVTSETWMSIRSSHSSNLKRSYSPSSNFPHGGSFRMQPSWTRIRRAASTLICWLASARRSWHRSALLAFLLGSPKSNLPGFYSMHTDLEWVG